jgi:peroxiredoxin
MLRRIGIILFFIIPLAVIVVLAFSNNNVNQNSSGPSKITIENFTLTDIYKKKHSLSDYNDSKAILIIFIATQCPVSNAYNSRMIELYNNYHDKNIAVVGINSNKQESMSECKSHAEKNGFKFPVLKDDKNVVADMFEASVTPEAYVLEPKTYKILYHGRIDDSKNESNVEIQDLENALYEILAGKKVSVAQTKAFGCTIKRI